MPFPTLFEEATGTPKRRTHHIPRNPLTTQGKILKARHEAEKALKNTHPRAAPPGSANDTPSTLPSPTPTPAPQDPTSSQEPTQARKPL
ncbi:hypothetical protein Slin15195_G041250 [Septoria linicola]|uniref:Uncharacterized protein n=1 Tax=Septoria linicola TaxID=215465 RepID=A0A9Q9EGG8_9PEZI|nr:hypothetical protein Slin15195_G041250 [Septoria linicola]